MERKHISENILLDFYKGNLESSMYISVLEHINTCEKCSEAYENIIEQDMIKTPENLKTQVIMSVKRIYDNKKVIDKKKAFNSYCIRVGFACAAAIALIFSLDTKIVSDATAAISIVNNMNIEKEIKTQIDDTKEFVNDLFNNMEVNYDKEEK